MKARVLIGAAALVFAGVLAGGGCGPADTPYVIKDSCLEGTLRCGGVDTIEECFADEWVSDSCTAVCEEVGMDSNGCSSRNDLCECGELLSQDCADGTAVFCACREMSGNPPCTPSDMEQLYVGCYQYDPDFSHVSCLALFLEGNQVDCDLAASVCM